MIDWKSLSVTPKTTIRDVIRVIDKASTQIALVIDDTGTLLGTITDGDIRRAILKGVNLEGLAETIMNANPITASPNDSKKKIVTKMKEKLIRHLPVVDDQKKIIRVETLEAQDILLNQSNLVVLMAGGKGNRLRPLTEDCPKPMLYAGDRPILETILANFIDHGFGNFYISVNYKKEMIQDHFQDGSKWGVNIRYLEETEQLGTAGALGLLPERPSQTIIVMNGDVLTNVNVQSLLHFHKSRKAVATMCVRKCDIQVPYGVVSMKKDFVTSIDEKPIHDFFANAGIYALEPEAFELITKHRHLDMTQLFTNLIQANKTVVAFPIREYWIDIGRHEDLKRAEGEFNQVFFKAGSQE